MQTSELMKNYEVLAKVKIIDQFESKHNGSVKNFKTETIAVLH
jgi:hypothetical protein